MYELWISTGTGFVKVAERANNESLRQPARERHEKDSARKNIYEIRLNGMVVEKSQNNQSWRMKWKKVCYPAGNEAAA